MAIDQAVRYETETILFNIGVTASDGRPEASVRRAFAKKFYSHLGFLGESLKVTRLEQYIEKSGKTEEFRRVFEQKKGSPWLEQRKNLAFNGRHVVETLMEVLGLPEADAQSWFNDKSEDTIAVDQLVEDIRDYVRSRPKNFRLLFMVDEVGQYIGPDTERLLDLQSLVEEIGSVCGGSVWVVCTGQEAVDEITKIRANEFSRIQARFKTRLALSSYSVGEVIQKRLLRKKPDFMAGLEALYNDNDSVLRNLFSFRDCKQDIKGFSGPQQFAEDYPFVPYQFKLMQTVFEELRRHGSAGKHLSSGERSMLSSFQEVAKAVQEADEYTLVPFYLFYGTVHTVLDSSIRRAIERCDKAADDGNGIMKFDVDVLKLLYLIRYVDDIKATLENIVILMADDIRMDKVALREKVRDALDRLQKQNYINRTSDTYMFLTDEEQDIQREIQNTMVDNASVSERIGNLIFSEIYTESKFKYGKYVVFPFDRMVDNVARGAQTGGLKLHFLTMASDAAEKDSTRLIMASKGQAMVVLADSSYYEALENALKIRRYVSHRNVSELPQSMQAIIRDRQKDATDLEEAAKKALGQAIQNAEYYVDGTHLTGKKSDSARTRIDQAMASLVVHVYSELSQIAEHADRDDDIRQVLLKGGKDTLQGIWPNQGAATIVEDYLRMQESNMLSTSMADIQSRYQAVPYGWPEIDIALVVARLVYEQKITIKQAGSTIQPDDRRLPGMLRKKSEIGKTAVALRQNVSIAALNKARKILGDYFDVMDVPRDEDGLVDFIVSHFEEQKGNLEELKRNYKGGRNYPGREDVEKAASLVNEVLSQRKDNVALMSAIAKLEDELFVSNKSLGRVKSFFTNQKHIFDGAVQMLLKMQGEKDHLRQEQGIRNALDGIRQIVAEEGRFDYNRIPDLNTLMMDVSSGYGRLLDAKRTDLLDNASQCMEAIHKAAGSNEKAQEIVSRAEKFYAEKEKEIKQEESLTRLDGQIMVLSREKDCFCLEIEKALLPEPEPDPKPGTDTESVSSGNGIEPKTPDQGQNRTGGGTEPEKPEVKPEVKTEPVPERKVSRCSRLTVFPAKVLNSEADIDAYVEKIRTELKSHMKGCDSIELN